LALALKGTAALPEGNRLPTNFATQPSNVSKFWQMVATGLVIVAAIGLDEFQRLGSTKLRARKRLQLKG